MEVIPLNMTCCVLPFKNDANHERTVPGPELNIKMENIETFDSDSGRNVNAHDHENVVFAFGILFLSDLHSEIHVPPVQADAILDFQLPLTLCHLHCSEWHPWNAGPLKHGIWNFTGIWSKIVYLEYRPSTKYTCKTQGDGKPPLCSRGLTTCTL